MYIKFGTLEEENEKFLDYIRVEKSQNEAAFVTKAVNTRILRRKSAVFYSTLSKCPSKEH